jgi:hypothetical protein
MRSSKPRVAIIGEMRATSARIALAVVRGEPLENVVNGVLPS